VITNTMAWPAESYDPSLPPPLCFTKPAGAVVRTSGQLLRGPGFHVTLRKPKLMMDPSDPTTWQRTYQFGTEGMGSGPAITSSAAVKRP
jgi:hypothetical protein